MSKLHSPFQSVPAADSAHSPIRPKPLPRSFRFSKRTPTSSHPPLAPAPYSPNTPSVSLKPVSSHSLNTVSLPSMAHAKIRNRSAPKHPQISARNCGYNLPPSSQMLPPESPPNSQFCPFLSLPVFYPSGQFPKIYPAPNPCILRFQQNPPPTATVWPVPKSTSKSFPPRSHSPHRKAYWSPQYFCPYRQLHQHCQTLRHNWQLFLAACFYRPPAIQHQFYPSTNTIIRRILFPTPSSILHLLSSCCVDTQQFRAPPPPTASLPLPKTAPFWLQKSS